MSWDDVTRESGGASEKTPYTKFENGATLIRILDDEPYSFWQHWLAKQNTSVLCMGKGCPICDVIKQMKAEGLAPIYNSTQRHAIRIWNYTTAKMEVLIQGRTFFSQLLTLHKEVGDIRGYDIKCIRKGSGTDTTYTLLPAAPTPFTTTEGVEEIDMAETFKIPTANEVRQLMEGKTWAEINGTDAA